MDPAPSRPTTAKKALRPRRRHHCANCEQPLCSQHAIAQLTDAGKKSGKFMCKQCDAARREYEKTTPAAAPSQPEKKAPAAEKGAAAAPAAPAEGTCCAGQGCFDRRQERRQRRRRYRLYPQQEVNAPLKKLSELAGLAFDGVRSGYVPPKKLQISSKFETSPEIEKKPRPGDFEVVRHALWNVNEEHGATIQRLSGSPVAMYALDLNPSILTEDAEFVYFGPYMQYMSASPTRR